MNGFTCLVIITVFTLTAELSDETDNVKMYPLWILLISRILIDKIFSFPFRMIGHKQ